MAEGSTKDVRKGLSLSGFRDTFEYVLLNSFMLALRLLPYPRRVALMGRLATTVIAPIAGWRQRVLDNLTMVMPDMPEGEMKRIAHSVPDNFGRSFIELHSGSDFFGRAAKSAVEGPGIEQLKEARRLGRPVVLVSGHLGNPYAVPAFLKEQGYEVGSVYRRLNNSLMNDKYVHALDSIGIPTFEKGKRGMVAAVRHLKKGGVLGMLIDIHITDSPLINFLGKPAATSTASAELALKYDAVLIPIYAVRMANGLDFRIVVQNEVAHSDPLSMTEEIVKGLETLVEANIDQWFWIHRRWKGGDASN